MRIAFLESTTGYISSDPFIKKHFLRIFFNIERMTKIKLLNELKESSNACALEELEIITRGPCSPARVSGVPRMSKYQENVVFTRSPAQFWVILEARTKTRSAAVLGPVTAD